MSCSYINFESNLAPFWQPWTPKILQKWGVTLDTMDSNPDKNGTSYRISLQDRFLTRGHHWTNAPRSIFDWFWSLQDVSKASQDASRWFQNVTKCQQFTLHIAQFAANTKRTCHSINNVAVVPMQAYYTLTSGLLAPALLTHTKRRERSNAQRTSICNHG